jgi:hypothetical protein
MTLPSWWSDGVRVVTEEGRAGTVRLTSAGWAVHLDNESALALAPDPSVFAPEVRQTLTQGQYERIVYDAERAVVRAFGCHYVPEWEALPDSVRMQGAPRPVPKNRPGLDGLRAVVYGAVKEALGKYVTG